MSKEMNQLPKTLLKAQTVKPEIECTIHLSLKGLDDTCKAAMSIYAYPITNFLIEKVGRFCEHYASDFLVSWDNIRKRIVTDDSGIYYIGIRDNGVDHNSYLFINLRDYSDYCGFADKRYRKIYAVEFHKRYEDRTPEEIPVDICIKDMHDIQFDKGDKDYPIDEIDK